MELGKNVKKQTEFRTSRKHIFNKRAIPKVDRKPNDLYISSTSNNKSYIERIEKLWASGEKEVTLHALGKSIPRAIVIALKLQEAHYNTYNVDVQTNSIDVVDDLIPTSDEDDFEVQRRFQSSVKIRIFKISTDQNIDARNTNSK